MSISPNRHRAILAAHGGVCHYCGSPHAHQVDHIVPRIDGGSDDLGNLIAACLPCNLRKHRHRLPPDAERRALDVAEALREKVLALDPPRRKKAGAYDWCFTAPNDWFVMLDELRRQETDVPTRAEMVRRIVDRKHEQTFGKSR